MKIRIVNLFLFTTLLLNLTSLVLADSVTTGSLGLIKPTTGQIDTRRSWADKLNSNMDVIAATMTTTLNRVTALETSVSTSGADILSLELFTATAAVRLDNLDTSTGTLYGLIGTTASVFTNSLLGISASTATLTTRLDNLDSSTRTLTLFASNTNYLNLSNSTQTKIGGIQINGVFTGNGRGLFGLTSASISSSTYISSGSALVNSFHLNTTGVSAGTYGDDANVAQLTVSADGRITAVTEVAIAASGGGGGIKITSVTVGPLGATDVDVASNTVDGLERALQILGAKGLTTSTTAQGVIYYRGNATYTMMQATIPAGITVYTLPNSSCSWRFDRFKPDQTLLTLYGKIENVNFDAAGSTFTSSLLNFKDNSRMRNCRIEGSQQMIISGGTSLNAPAVFRVADATNVFVGLDVDGYIYRDSITFYGDSAPFMILRSTYVTLELNTKNGTRNDNASFAIGVLMSVDITIQNGNWHNVGGRYLMIGEGCYGINVFRNSIRANSGSAAQGLLNVSSIRAQVRISTGVTIDSNYIILDNGDGASSNVISVVPAGGNDGVFGLYIVNNVVRAHQASNYRFCLLNSGTVFRAVLRGNRVDGTGNGFISDSGTNTSYTGLGNFLNGVEQ